MANAIRHRRDDDQPDMVGRAGTLKITGNTRTRAKMIFRFEYFRQGTVKSYEPGRKTTGYDVARDGVDRSVAADWENLTLIDGSITKDLPSRWKQASKLEY